MKGSLLAALAFAFIQLSASAQTYPTNIDICMQQEPGMLRVSIRANDFDFGSVISGLVFTIRWNDASTSSLGVGTNPWCANGAALSIGPSAPVTPGNGYKYKTWTSTGLAMLSEIPDNGGCGQTLLADTWTEVLDIPINNDVNGTFFELSNDTYTTANNLDYWLSLDGGEINSITQLPYIGIICSQTTAVRNENAQQSLLSLAPNPASGIVRINLAKVEGAFTYEVIDPLGRAVEMKYVAASSGPWTGSIDLSNVEAGAYQIRIHLAGQVHTSTVLVQH